MNYILIIILAMLPYVSNPLPNSIKIPTLSEEEYTSAKETDVDYPYNVQILYSDSYNEVGTYIFSRSLQIYGNGVILIREKEIGSGSDEYKFYSTSDDALIEVVTDKIVDLGIFKSITGKCASDAVGVIQHSYYLSLRIGEEYYSITTSVHEGEEPEWLPLVEYMSSVIDEYMIDDNEIKGSEYLVKREEIVEIYGYLASCGDTAVKAYVEEVESSNED